MSTSCTDFDHPYFDQLNQLSSKERINFFLEDNSKKMKFVSLGESLDFVSFGFMNGVCYDTSVSGMARFIRTWMRAQEPKREFVEIPIGKTSYRTEEDITKREYHYEWNKFHQDYNLELPRININNAKCPRDESHRGTMEDVSGKIRCSSVDNSQRIKKGFMDSHTYFDHQSRAIRLRMSESAPFQHPSAVLENGEELPTEENKYKAYLKDKERFDNEPPVSIIDPCYAIIRENESKYLPLQTILDRLNVSPTKDNYMNPFSGFNLANLVKAWWEQPGRKRVWRRKSEQDYFRVFPNFRVISSDD